MSAPRTFARWWRLWLVGPFVALLALPLLARQASAQSDVVISTGMENGSYYFIGDRLRTEVILELTPRVEVRTSEGSIDNLARLADPESPVNVALSQADALDLYLADHPDFAEGFFVLGDVGRECVFLIAGADGPRSVAQLKQDGGGGRISVGQPGSGAAVTWRSMTRLEPAFGNTSSASVPTMEALLQLKVGGGFSDLRAAMVVQRPRRDSPPIEQVLEAPDTYRIVPIETSDLPNAKLADGSEVYTFERVLLGGKRRKGSFEVDTLCTRGLLLGSRAKLSQELRGGLSKLMLEAGERIVGADE